MKFKLTKLEKSWVLYDVGNSAFILLVSTIIPIYAEALMSAGGVSSADYLAYWGYAASISTLIVAFIGPILGLIADTNGYKKRLFMFFVLIGVISLSTLWLPSTWQSFLLLFVIAKVGYAASLIFNDSMLTDITTPDRMDAVSTSGYAWGYIGSCIPFIISLALVLGEDSLPLPFPAINIAFILTAVWWFVCALPLYKNHKQIHFREEAQKGIIKHSFKRLYTTLKRIRKHPKILFFLLAFFFYIDGVYTIIEMATAYGSAVGLDTTGLLIALLVTQIVAFPSALTVIKLAHKYSPSALIKASIIGYILISLFAIQLDKQWEFWVLAVCVGLFQGGIQSLSRSYFAQIIPPENAGEYFGIYDIFGKGAAFLGTFLVGFISQTTGNEAMAITVLPVLFIIGYILFNKMDKI